jgi:hypothetical protein
MAIPQELIDLTAAVFVTRFGDNGGRQAWQRAHQSYGWEDDPEMLREWKDQVQRGMGYIRQLRLGGAP